MLPESFVADWFLEPAAVHDLVDRVVAIGVRPANVLLQFNWQRLDRALGCDAGAVGSVFVGQAAKAGHDRHRSLHCACGPDGCPALPIQTLFQPDDGQAVVRLGGWAFRLSVIAWYLIMLQCNNSSFSAIKIAAFR